MTTSHPIVDAYVAAINGHDPEALLTCFADDAVLRHPAGTFSGDEIAGFYRDVVFAGRTMLTPGAVLVDGPVVMVELAAGSALDPDGEHVHAIDVFKLDPAGRIAELEIYYR